jgi:predicted outer membrane lipoprotein
MDESIYCEWAFAPLYNSFHGELPPATSIGDLLMDRLNPWILGTTAATTFSIVSTICALAVVLFPDGTMGFFNTWFHGLDLRLLKPPGGQTLTLGQFFYGLVGVAATSFVVGTLFAAVYNLIQPRGQ